MSKNRIIVGDMSWADMIPDWLLEEIKAERLIYGLAVISNPEAPKIGDAEVAAYLMTASMRAPMPGEYVEAHSTPQNLLDSRHILKPNATVCLFRVLMYN